MKGFHDALEPEVSLAVDSMLPKARLVTLLREFHTKFPTVPVRLLIETLGGGERALRSATAVIGVGNTLHMDMTGFRQIDIPGVQLVPVAARGHPLASANEARQPRTRDYVQIVLSEQAAGGGKNFGVVSLNTWRVNDLNAKRTLILGGIGWGGMPEPLVRADIEAGRLVRLNLRDWRGGEYQMKVVHNIDTPPGPAGRWLIDRLTNVSDANEEVMDGRRARSKRK